MQVIATKIPDVKIIIPKLFGDDRGFFYESLQQKRYQDALETNQSFVQDNISRSKKGVLRGLHFQIQHPQGKLVTVLEGSVFDVAVDIRHGSETFGTWVGIHLSAENKQQFWIPEGFAHGFVVLSDYATFMYKCTNYYYPEFEKSIHYQDPTLAIQWPSIDCAIETSLKDTNGLLLHQIEPVCISPS